MQAEKIAVQLQRLLLVADAFTVSNLAGYISSSSTSLDYEDVPECKFLIPGLCIFEDGPLSWDRQISDELRVSFDNQGPLSAIRGVNYSHCFDYTTHNFVGLAPSARSETAAAVLQPVLIAKGWA